MKKLLLLLLLFTGVTNAQIVNIPDANFKSFLVSQVVNRAKDFEGNYLVVDANGDKEIQIEEALAIYYLDVRYQSISDLTGIEEFLNLEIFACSENNITILDISKNINLKELYCASNELVVLDIDKNLSLESLDCSSNKLTGIDISKHVNLQYLNCSSNQLTDLDVSNNLWLLNLNCSSNEFATLDVSNNTDLKTLLCRSLQLTSLEVSNNINLETLDISLNQIVGLDISNNISLISLMCFSNQLVSLNVWNNVNLVNLGCFSNQLTSLDVSNNINLKTLGCSSNLLTNLDVNNNINLEVLACSFNELTALDVGSNKKLYNLDCPNNQLTILDISQNPDINYLYTENNKLTELFIKNGRDEKILDFSNNPNLVFICTDETQIASVQANAAENVVVNSYCSFIPGGDFNTISGVLRLDEDFNGCDVTDLPLKNIKININDGTIQGSTFTYNDQGSYAFNTGKVGTYTIEPVIENTDWFTVSPLNSIVAFSDIDNSISTQNFCVTPNGVHNDTEIIISPITPARPGFDAEYKIIYKNKGNQTLSGTVDFAFDDEVLDYVSASVSPDSQSIGNLSWNYTNLLPFESRSFYMTLNVNSPMETPAVNIDDILKFTVTINPISGDETPIDNVFEFNQKVVGSFDPNDIVCLEGDIAKPSMIGEYLHYVVNFENTGTAAATFVVVKDVVDITKYDINSLQILSTSHNMETKIIGSKVEFVFYSINLGANKKGHVVFKIKSLNTLVTGNDVTKKADIYFDYNFPIETNLATTTFQNTLSSQVFKIDGSVSVSPNPTKDILNVRTNSFIKSIQIYDVQGRIVVTKLLNEKNSLIDISNFSNGIYFLKIKTEVGGKIEKVIKD